MRALTIALVLSLSGYAAADAPRGAVYDPWGGATQPAPQAAPPAEPPPPAAAAPVAAPPPAAAPAAAAPAAVAAPPPVSEAAPPPWAPAPPSSGEHSPAGVVAAIVIPFVAGIVLVVALDVRR